jgi:hypothetical protein
MIVVIIILTIIITDSRIIYLRSWASLYFSMEAIDEEIRSK